MPDVNSESLPELCALGAVSSLPGLPQQSRSVGTRGSDQGAVAVSLPLYPDAIGYQDPAVHPAGAQVAKGPPREQKPGFLLWSESCCSFWRPEGPAPAEGYSLEDAEAGRTKCELGL